MALARRARGARPGVDQLRRTAARPAAGRPGAPRAGRVRPGQECGQTLLPAVIDVHPAPLCSPRSCSLPRGPWSSGRACRATARVRIHRSLKCIPQLHLAGVVRYGSESTRPMQGRRGLRRRAAGPERRTGQRHRWVGSGAEGRTMLLLGTGRLHARCHPPLLLRGHQLAPGWARTLTPLGVGSPALNRPEGGAKSLSVSNKGLCRSCPPPFNWRLQLHPEAGTSRWPGIGGGTRLTILAPHR